MVFYFGCWSDENGTRLGHHLYSAGGHSVGRDVPVDFPVRVNCLDSGFLPPGLPQEEGHATLCHINGWTILTFWDRSVDARHGSNSSFILRGTHDFDNACLIAKAEFPSIWKRFHFSVRIPGTTTEAVPDEKICPLCLHPMRRGERHGVGMCP